MSKSERDQNQDTKFVVELQGLKLPDEVSKQIESEIRQIVMREIAKLDFEGDLRVEKRCIEIGPLGLWIRVPETRSTS